MSLSRIATHLRGGFATVTIRRSSVMAAPLSVFTVPERRRCFGTSAVHADKLATKSVQLQDWSRAVSDAEKVVGYPTSFLNLRWLLSDEIANVALHLRKLVGSTHPLLKTAKNLLYNGKNNMQAWGLIVLLVSKAAGHAATVTDMEQDKSAGVLHSQRALAEVTEMIRISHLVHQGLVNLQPLTVAGTEIASHSDMMFGNKIALLSGDYLLGNSCAELAALKNQDLIELISSAVKDLVESEFIGDRDEQNIPVPSKPRHRSLKAASVNAVHPGSQEFDTVDMLLPIDKKTAMGNPEKEWELRNILSAASLLGKSCQGAMKLAGHSQEIEKQGYLFGKHLALAWQACLDLEPFLTNTLEPDTQFSLVSAPVLFQLDYDPTLYDEIEKGQGLTANMDFVKIHAAVVRGPCVEKARLLQRKHSMASMKCLDVLPPSDARAALQNIIHAMQDL